MRRKTYKIGFFTFLMIWIIMSFLCYLGIIAFDTKTLSGALMAGLFLSYSMIGGIKFLKEVYDEVYGRVREFRIKD